MSLQYQEYLEFALELGYAAEAIAMAGYQHSDAVLKGDGTEVTIADRKAELRLRSMIARRYPTHEILGEEFGGGEGVDARFTWVLDPIDGTSWFAMGAPLFGTLIALLDRGEPVVGVVRMPALQETVSAAKGAGCWCSSRTSTRKRASVARPQSLHDAVVTASGIHGTDFAADSQGPVWHLRQLAGAARKFRFYGDCVQHALVCRGLTHAAVDTVMKPWDIAAIIPCIQEAGGIVGGLDGRTTGLLQTGTLVTACCQRLYEQIVEIAAVGREGSADALRNPAA